jgi:hypothetical protein
MPSLRVCPSCGNSSFSDTPPVKKEAETHRQASPTVSVDEAKEPAAVTAARTSWEAKSQTDSKELVGVRGWLGFFVIQAVFIAPVLNLLQLVGLIDILQSLPESGLKYWLTFCVCITALLTLFGLFVGTQIWRIKKDAIKHAKIYLKAAILYNFIVGFGLIYNEDISSVLSLITSVLVVIIWHIYMDKSARVKNTFG